MLKKGKYVSIDIGEENTKIVQGNEKKGIIYVENMCIISTPKNCIKDGKILNRKTLAKFIEKELKKSNIKSKKVIFTLQSSSVITREIILPYIKKDEFNQMIKFEIEQYLPVNMDEYIIEHLNFEKINENKCRVLVIAVLKKMVDEYLNLTKDLKLSPYSLDVNFNASYKIFQNQLNKDEKTIAICDFGSNSIEICIIKANKIEFTRMIRKGGSDIDVNIANSMNVSILDAREKKFMYADMNYNGDSVLIKILNEAIKSIVDEWVDEMDRNFKYYMSRSRENSIDEIHIYGGSSYIKNITNYIQDKVAIKTIIANDFTNVNKSKNIRNLKSEQCLNSMGSLIKNDINLFAPYIEKNKKRDKRLAITSVILSFVVSFMVLFAVYTKMELNQLNGQKKSLQQYLNSKDIKNKLDEIKKEKENERLIINYYNELQLVSKDIDRIDKINDKLLKNLSMNIPTDIFLRQINISENQIQIHGISQIRNSVAELEYNLKELGIFKSVHVSTIDKENDSINFSFDLECKLKDGA